MLICKCPNVVWIYSANKHINVAFVLNHCPFSENLISLIGDARKSLVLVIVLFATVLPPLPEIFPQEPLCPQYAVIIFSAGI